MQITIRPYLVTDEQACLQLFESNCPLYFDASELALFANWLKHQGTGATYQSPTYSNALHDSFYVITEPQLGIVACGGFYIVNHIPEARMAWGMVAASLHNKGYGRALYAFRKHEIELKWPQHQITLGTSQHTYQFCEKMGLKVQQIIPQGYGPLLDRIDMVAL